MIRPFWLPPRYWSFKAFICAVAIYCAYFYLDALIKRSLICREYSQCARRIEQACGAKRYNLNQNPSLGSFLKGGILRGAAPIYLFQRWNLCFLYFQWASSPKEACVCTKGLNFVFFCLLLIASSELVGGVITVPVGRKTWYVLLTGLPALLALAFGK